MSIVTVPQEASWRPRPLLAAGVRLLAYGTPIAVGTVAVQLVSGPLAGALPHLAAVGATLAVGVLVSLLVSRATIRLMPLAVLLRMTMIFPDRAPTRLRVARRATSMREITARLSSPRLEESEAAATMLSLVTALGRHDRRTRGHSERVRLFCDLLSRELDLTPADAGRLRWAALIHDIGKLEVAATILNKPGALNPREWTAIKRHPEAGAKLAAPLAAWLGPWFNGILEHHEKYDGSGYPRGVAGAAISPSGRAVAVVDAFETMTAARSYKAARSVIAARQELTRCAGTHFDPVMVRAFLQIALPRLLWSVGPLAFLINVPYLRWVGEGGARLADAASVTASTASSAAGVTAVAVAVSALPPAAAAQETPAHHHHHKVVASVHKAKHPHHQAAAHHTHHASTHPAPSSGTTHPGTAGGSTAGDDKGRSTTGATDSTGSTGSTGSDDSSGPGDSTDHSSNGNGSGQGSNGDGSGSGDGNGSGSGDGSGTGSGTGTDDGGTTSGTRHYHHHHHHGHGHGHGNGHGSSSTSGSGSGDSSGSGDTGSDDSTGASLRFQRLRRLTARAGCAVRGTPVTYRVHPLRCAATLDSSGCSGRGAAEDQRGAWGT